MFEDCVSCVQRSNPGVSSYGQYFAHNILTVAGDFRPPCHCKNTIKHIFFKKLKKVKKSVDTSHKPLYNSKAGCGRAARKTRKYGVLAQLGEHLPYKQRVIGSSPIGPISYGGIAQLARAHGSYPWCRGFESPSRYLYGILAQLGEHLPYKQRVIGSSPIGPIDINICLLYTSDAADEL